MSKLMGDGAGETRQAEAQRRWVRVFRSLGVLYSAYYKRPTQVWDLAEEYLSIRGALKELMEAYDAWLD